MRGWAWINRRAPEANELLGANQAILSASMGYKNRRAKCETWETWSNGNAKNDEQTALSYLEVKRLGRVVVQMKSLDGKDK